MGGTIESFLFAVLVYFLFALVVDAFVKDPRSNEIFKVILVIICILIALGGGLFIHV